MFELKFMGILGGTFVLEFVFIFEFLLYLLIKTSPVVLVLGPG